MNRAHVFKIGAWLGVALALGLRAQSAHGQRCAPTGAPVIVTEGRGAAQPSIVATAQGIVVAWSEGPSSGYVRVFNGNTLTAVGPARRVSEAAARGASSVVALAPLSDGRIAEGHCVCASGRASCAASIALGAGAAPSITASSNGGASCAAGGTSGAAVGNDLLFVSQFATRDRVRAFGTAVVAREELGPILATDAHALLPVANARAMLFVQSAGSATARLLDARGAPTGATVTLSRPGAIVGPSASTRINDAALVLFAQRADAAAPSRVHVARWNGVSAPVHAELDLGETNVSPLSVVPSRAGCYLLAWRAPSGSKLAQVCNDRVVQGTVTALATPAGATQTQTLLASNGVEAFVLTWIQRDRDPRHHQLALQRIGCR